MKHVALHSLESYISLYFQSEQEHFHTPLNVPEVMWGMYYEEECASARSKTVILTVVILCSSMTGTKWVMSSFSLPNVDDKNCSKTALLTLKCFCWKIPKTSLIVKLARHMEELCSATSFLSWVTVHFCLPRNRHT